MVQKARTVINLANPPIKQMTFGWKKKFAENRVRFRVRERVCKTDKKHNQRENSHRDKRSKHKTKQVHKVTDSDNTVWQRWYVMLLHSMTEADGKILWTTTDVHGVKLKMKLDREWLQCWLFSKVAWEKTSVTLKTYTGEKMSQNVSYSGKTKQFELYVLKGGGPALFGCNWLIIIIIKKTQLAHDQSSQCINKQQQPKP